MWYSRGHGVGAHPRVGGENVREMRFLTPDEGSSPRGRGKPRRKPGNALRGGSSPRGRGKRPRRNARRHRRRLIPAWAGKTAPVGAASAPSKAHPRVGGENSDMTVIAVAATGSSPRGRGKRRASLLPDPPLRLIPAWAGKTAPPCMMLRGLAAHPRVGGENRARARQQSFPRGSSPRGRGKRNPDAPRRGT